MNPMLFGWVKDEQAVRAVLSQQDMPYFDAAVRGTPTQGIGRGRVVLLYEAVYKTLDGKFNTRRQGIGDCFPADAPVRMADGSEKPIQDVRPGDIVISHLNRPQRVLNTIAKQFTGDMVTITPVGYSFPLTATADHRVVTYPEREYGRNNVPGHARQRTSERTAWRPVGSLEPGVRVLLPRITACEGATTERLDVRAMARCDLRHYQTINRGRPTLARFKNPVTCDSVAVDERFARFVGLFLAEGSVEDQRVAFSLSRHEELLAHELLELGAALFGVSGRVQHMPSKPNVIVVQFNSTPLARFFSALIPGNVWDKSVPACFMRAGRGVKLALLRGWCDGDGSGREYNQNVGTSVSCALRYSLAALAMAAGLKPCCPTRKARGRSKAAGNVTFYGDDLYALYPERTDTRVRAGRVAARTQLGLALPVKTITRAAVQNVTVYCLEVENDHSFVVSGYAVHNCVSMGSAYAVDALRAIQCVNGQSSWVAETATEVIYAMSRVEIGGGALGGGDGSTGAWAAQAVKKLGTIVRQKYGSIDLTTYSPERARQWGMPRAGCPDELEPIAREHLVKTVSLVRTWDELCDAIAAGYPVTIASNVGFDGQSSRDSDGFLRQSGSWAHQMCFPPDVQIATSGGTKQISEIRVGDTVQGHDGYLHPVTEVFSRPYRGDLVGIQPAGGQLLRLTPNHPVLVRRKMVHRERTAIYPGVDYATYGNGNAISTQAKIAARAWMTAAPVWVAAEDVQVGDWLLAPSPLYATSAPTPAPLAPSADVAYLLGMYAADGHATARHKLVITLQQHETQEAARCVAALKQLGCTAAVRPVPGAKAIRVTAYSAELADKFLAWFGGGTEPKQLPEFVFNGDWDLACVLQGLLEGDGCTRKDGSHQIASTSQALVWQTQQILLRLGEHPYIDEAKWTKAPTVWLPLYIVRWRPSPTKLRCRWWQNHYHMPVTSITRQAYDGTVHNFEVDKVHSYLANGVSVHNCILGIDDQSSRPGALIQNSWGTWIGGPKRHNQPDGSFWAERRSVERILSENDSWAYSEYMGFPPKKLDWAKVY